MATVVSVAAADSVETAVAVGKSVGAGVLVGTAVLAGTVCVAAAVATDVGFGGFVGCGGIAVFVTGTVGAGVGVRVGIDCAAVVLMPPKMNNPMMIPMIDAVRKVDIVTSFTLFHIR